MKAHGEFRYNSNHCSPWQQMQVRFQRQALPPLPSEKQPMAPTGHEAWGATEQACCFGAEKNILPLQVIYPRLVCRPAPGLITTNV